VALFIFYSYPPTAMLCAFVYSNETFLFVSKCEKGAKVVNVSDQAIILKGRGLGVKMLDGFFAIPYELLHSRWVLSQTDDWSLAGCVKGGAVHDLWSIHELPIVKMPNSKLITGLPDGIFSNQKSEFG
jgi:hypothetical protein